MDQYLTTVDQYLTTVLYFYIQLTAHALPDKKKRFALHCVFLRGFSDRYAPHDMDQHCSRSADELPTSVVNYYFVGKLNTPILMVGLSYMKYPVCSVTK